MSHYRLICQNHLDNLKIYVCIVDANHAGNVVTRRSHSGILLFIQKSPILWLRRQQNTVETSMFGSEFVALQTHQKVGFGKYVMICCVF